MGRPLGRRRINFGDLRQHFTVKGDPKRSWPDKEAAEKAAARHHKRAYQCPTCNRWHIGGAS